MNTIVMKFGGSSVADNEKLKIVASKIINMYEKVNIHHERKTNRWKKHY